MPENPSITVNTFAAQLISAKTLVVIPILHLNAHHEGNKQGCRK